MTSNLILFSANLAFILTNVYGCLLKWFYKPQAYNENFVQLFPAYRAVGLFYLLQVLELPYLLHIGQADALLYVNAFSLILYPPLMLVMCGRYFFPENPTPVPLKGRGGWSVLRSKLTKFPSLGEALGIGLLLPLLLQAVGLIQLPEWHRSVAFTLVGALFVWYFWRNIRMALHIGRAVRRVNEDTYADTDDFPTRAGEKLQWLPTSICLLIAVNFFLDDPAVKALRDVLFTVVNVWFCIYTLNPRRKAFEATEMSAPPSAPEGGTTDPASESRSHKTIEAPSGAVGGASEGGTSSRLSPDRYAELSRRLESLLTDERIFTEQHITADLLMQRLGINANYLTEVIQRSGYASFYDMISQHRVRHAISLIRQQPDRRLADIAVLCGFTSQSSMTKAFTSQGKESPSSYRKKDR